MRGGYWRKPPTSTSKLPSDAIRSSSTGPTRRRSRSDEAWYGVCRHGWRAIGDTQGLGTGLPGKHRSHWRPDGQRQVRPRPEDGARDRRRDRQRRLHADHAGLPVLTAAPSSDELAAAPLPSVRHGRRRRRLVGGQVADRRRRRAGRHRRPGGRTAIVVGGTGLYFRALTHGLADVPPVPETQREISALLYAAQGEPEFRDVLAELDPEAEKRIEIGDRQRLVRAHAVAVATGKSLTAWQTDTRPALAEGTWRGVVLDPPRDELLRPPRRPPGPDGGTRRPGRGARHGGPGPGPIPPRVESRRLPANWRRIYGARRRWTKRWTRRGRRHVGMRSGR